MSINVTVALVGDPQTAFEGLQWPGDFMKPYEKRPKVDLVVDEDETLGEVLGRAAEHWNVASAHGFADVPAFVEFYRPDHRPMMKVELALLDADGRVYFTHDWRNVTHSDLLAADEAGLLMGDPRRPYLLLQPGMGNGSLIDWAMLAGIWQAFRDALGFLDEAGRGTRQRS